MQITYYILYTGLKIGAMCETMQKANKTINTKIGLDLPMSEQVRKRQVTLNEGKTLVNTKGCIQNTKFNPRMGFRYQFSVPV